LDEKIIQISKAPFQISNEYFLSEIRFDTGPEEVEEYVSIRSFSIACRTFSSCLQCVVLRVVQDLSDFKQDLIVLVTSDLRALCVRLWWQFDLH
jgi:hypothetical protein